MIFRGNNTREKDKEENAGTAHTRVKHNFYTPVNTLEQTASYGLLPYETTVPLNVHENLAKGTCVPAIYEIRVWIASESQKIDRYLGI